MEKLKKSMNYGNVMCTYDYGGDPVYCHCGKKAPLVTSTSDENPGRRFFGCSNYQVDRCRFFLWHHRPIEDEYLKTVFIHLRDANRDLKRENSLLKEKNNTLRRMNAELKTGNEPQTIMSCRSNIDDLYNEVGVLKAENEAIQERLKNVMIETRMEARAKRLYKLALMFTYLRLLFFVLRVNGDNKMTIELLALP